MTHLYILIHSVVFLFEVPPGPRRDIFPGGTKINAGPAKSVEEQKKRSSLKFGPVFCPNLGEEQKKKVFTQIWSCFLPKFR